MTPIKLSQKLIIYAAMALLCKSVWSIERYSIGVVPQFDQQRIFLIWNPILEELESRTGLKFDLVGTRNIPDFETEYLNGKFDFSYMNPYFMLLGHNQQGYTPLVRDISKKLYGIIVVRKDSQINKVEQLKGKMVAFPSPNAVGASLITRADFKNKFKMNITPLYVKTHTSVYLNVIKGLTSAGGGVQKTLSQQPKAIRDKLRVLYRTQKFNSHPIAAHPRVPLKHRLLVQKALLEMGESKQFQEAFRKIPISKIGKARIEDYKDLKNMQLEKVYININK